MRASGEPVLVDDRVLRRLLSGETRRANEGVVADPVPLSSVLGEARPLLRTRSGAWHALDPAAVQRLHAALSPLARALLMVPITFRLDHEAPGMCYLTEEAARDAVVQLGLEVGALRGGRAWVSFARAQEFARRWPSLVQFMRM